MGLLAGLLAGLHAQEGRVVGGSFGIVGRDGQVVLAGPYQRVLLPSEGLVAVQDSTGLWGFRELGVDGEAGWRVRPRYTAVTPFADGLAAVQEDRKWGFIETSGELLVAPIYDEVTLVGGFPAIVRIGAKRGFINHGAQPVLSLRFDEIQKPKEGRIWARRDAAWQLYDMLGRPVGELLVEAAMPFAEGLAAVRLQGRWGFVDNTGAGVIGPEYEAVGSFSGGRALAKQGGKWGVLNRLGAWVVEAKYDALSSAVAGQYVAWQREKGYAVLNTYGRMTLGWVPGQLVALGQGVFAYSEEGMAGMYLLDATGEQVGQERYEAVRPYSEGLAAARKGERWGFINERGVWVLAPEYPAVEDFSERRATVQHTNGLWGYCDRRGAWVAQPQFKLAGSFEGGYAMVQWPAGH